jgi:endonuclease G
MKTSALYSLLLSALITLTACEANDDDKLPTKPNSGQADDTNKNKNTTGDTNLDSRLEVPHTVKTANNTLLIRTVPNFGVNYIIEWDNQKRAQRWTAFQMYNGNSGTAWNRNNWNSYADSNEWVAKNIAEYGFADPFQPDPDLDPQYRTELEEYKGCGYSRGHICASADRLNSKDANEQTFYLSNIMPQSSKLNTGTWANMENQVRVWNDKKYRNTLYVVKGGTIDDKHVLAPTRTGMVVPEYFYMAILSELAGTYRAIAFILDHASPEASGTQPKNYVFTIDQLEQLTGIDFFCNLPDNIEDEVESSVDRTFWKMN